MDKTDSNSDTTTTFQGSAKPSKKYESSEFKEVCREGEGTTVYIRAPKGPNRDSRTHRSSFRPQHLPR